MLFDYNGKEYNVIIEKKYGNKNTYIRVKKDLNIYKSPEAPPYKRIQAPQNRKRQNRDKQPLSPYPSYFVF